ncbi:MAG: hypothetical protein MJY93_08055 [Fibrobacter sp.]|nr:hypothetical protein [Fibrobacter sp.]
MQSVSSRHYTEIRIGRDGFPYDAFAEFGEVVATVNGREVTKTFKMNSGNVSNARLEFNFGKNVGSVYFSDVSLNCLDCGNTVITPSKPGAEPTESDYLDYVVVANTINFRDNSKAMGNVVGGNVELGVDSKIYGDVNVSDNCNLREHAYVVGALRYATFCTEQNGVYAATKTKVEVQKPSVQLPEITLGTTPVSVNLDGSLQLAPGNYGPFYANTRAKVRFSSGSYSFQNFYTEPDAEISFDMTSGPISISVAGNVRFGDRNKLSVIGGNPSEVTWNVNGESVNFGTDGLYFGKVVAPNAFVRIPSRSHLVGGVYANKFLMEPQSTVSQEPRADEISHSEEHFGPFFNPGVYRYKSVVSTQTSNIEMFVYADDANVKVNGNSSKLVELSSSNQSVVISLTRNIISDFPVEAFYSNYVFDFSKSANYKVYWNPQTQCKQGCDGSSALTAIGDFETVLTIAKSTGREINMTGGIWDVTESFSDGIVPWKVGFELVGFTGDVWQLASANKLPVIFLGESSHIAIYGMSPRSLKGFWIGNGYNKESGGVISSESSHLKMMNVYLSAHKSDKDGGALFSVDTVDLYNVHFKNCQAKGNGGAINVGGLLNMQNVIFDANVSGGNGGASFSEGDVIARNVIYNQNKADGEGGALFVSKGLLKISNATIFDNFASRGHAAIGGYASGLIYNSIMWKNIKSSCSLENCKKELAPSVTVNHSIVETNYNGTGNLIDDPKFYDEGKPGGDNDYMSIMAGLTLQDGSPAIGTGVKDAFVLETDILNMVRTENIDMGAYAWYDLNVDTELGEYAYGLFKKKLPAYPVFEVLGNEHDIVAVGNSPKGRVMRKKMPKSQVSNVKKAVIEYTLLDEYGSPYSDIAKQKVIFYKVGEENGKVVFQTLKKDPASKDYNPDKHGRLLVFTSDTKKVGIYRNVQVFPIIGLADKFYAELIDWE